MPDIVRIRNVSGRDLHVQGRHLEHDTVIDVPGKVLKPDEYRKRMDLPESYPLPDDTALIDDGKQVTSWPTELYAVERTTSKSKGE